MTPTDLDALSRDDLVAIILRQALQVEESTARVRQLESFLEEARRAGKRQAALFSKGPPKAHPKRPGRKPGDAHGPSHFRPPPAAVEEDLDAPLPAGCPDCGDILEEEGVEEQWQTDIVPAHPVRRRFRVHVGRCRGCRRRVQGRHPFQTSDALGAAASQLGPHALSVATFLRGEMGASFGKIQKFLRRVLGVEVCRGGLAQALQRVARKAEPTYESLLETVRQSPVVYADETGARMRGRPWWLRAFTTPDTIVYLPRPSRGFDVIEEILGADWAGKINHDGWTPYCQVTGTFTQLGDGNCYAPDVPLRRTHWGWGDVRGGRPGGPTGADISPARARGPMEAPLNRAGVAGCHPRRCGERRPGDGCSHASLLSRSRSL